MALAYRSQEVGGWTKYPDRIQSKTFFRASTRNTRSVIIASGQVLKAFTFLESDNTGKMVAHSGLSESALVTFTALTAGQTLVMAGLTFTAGTNGTTIDQLVKAFDGLSAGYTGGTVTGGVFTGTLTGYDVAKVDADSVVFNSTTANIDAVNVANATGTGTVTISITAGDTTFAPVAGVLLYDVDASAGDVVAEAYTKASFWADAINWQSDPLADTITLADGTTKAVTAYNTGAHGNPLLQSKFVEGTPFVDIGHLAEGEVA